MPEPLRLFVATSNPGKLRDFALGAGTSQILLEPLPGLAALVAPAEDQPTFEGNAALKARFYAQHAPGTIVLADDSGLEVDGLDGAPGVRSARYADDMGLLALPGEPLDARNNRCLQQALLGLDRHRRTAQYRCALAAVRDGVLLATASGSVEGVMLERPRGAGGFGYDPLFFLPELNRTFAELAPAERLALSHRGRALAALLPMLQAAMQR